MFFKKSKKIIVVMLLLSFMVPSFSSVSLSPQKAEATLPTYDYANWALGLFGNLLEAAQKAYQYALNHKELILDGMANYLAKAALQGITEATVKWINSGFDGNPAFITDPGQFMQGVGDKVIGQYIDGYGLNFLCSPFHLQIRVALEQDFSRSGDPVCTLSGAFNNIENSIEEMGNDWNWDKWATISQSSNNNAFGSYLETSIRINSEIAMKQNEYKEELSWGSGFMSQKHCEDVQVQDGDDIWVTEERCETVTPGDTIADSLNKSLGAGHDALVTADEINEVVGALLTQLVKSMFENERGLRGVYEDGYFDQQEDSGLGGISDNVNNSIDQDIEMETKYLEAKKRTLAALESSLLYIKDLAAGCSALNSWVNDRIRETNESIKKVKADIKKSQELINALQALKVASSNVGNNDNMGEINTCDEVDPNRLVAIINKTPRTVPEWQSIPVTASIGEVSFIDSDKASFEINHPNWPKFTDSRADELGYSRGSIPLLQGACWYDTSHRGVVCGEWDYNIIKANSNNYSVPKDFSYRVGDDYGFGVYFVLIDEYNDKRLERTAIKWISVPESHKDTRTLCDRNANVFCGTFYNPGKLPKNDCSGEVINVKDDIDIEKVIWGNTIDNRDIIYWPITTELKMSLIYNIDLSFDKTNVWEPVEIGDGMGGFNASAWVFRYQNGKWVGRTWTDLRPGKTILNKNTLVGEAFQPKLNGWVPESGELYGFMVSGLARNGKSNFKQRSNIRLEIWP